MPRGSKPGERRGGRQPGVKNKATIERELLTKQAIAEAQAGGLMPKDYILGVLRGTVEFDPIKFRAAEAAAPYCHPKLASVDMRADVTMRAEDMTDEQLQARAAEVDRLLGGDVDGGVRH